jgi:hypothetical protein
MPPALDYAGALEAAAPAHETCRRGGAAWLKSIV